MLPLPHSILATIMSRDHPPRQVLPRPASALVGAIDPVPCVAAALARCNRKLNGCSGGGDSCDESAADTSAEFGVSIFAGVAAAAAIQLPGFALLRFLGAMLPIMMLLLTDSNVFY